MFGLSIQGEQIICESNMTMIGQTIANTLMNY